MGDVNTHENEADLLTTNLTSVPLIQTWLSLCLSLYIIFTILAPFGPRRTTHRFAGLGAPAERHLIFSI
jgi:hypothetical protein